MKGFKGGKVGDRNDATFPSKSYYRDLDGVFWRNPFPDPSSAVTQNQEVVEVSIGLVFISMFMNLSLSHFCYKSQTVFFFFCSVTDDIEIDEPVPVASTSTNKPEKNQKGKVERLSRMYIVTSKIDG